MRTLKSLVLAFIAFPAIICSGQPIDNKKFFTEEGIIEMTLTTDIRNMRSVKGEEVFQPAIIQSRFPDSTVIEEPILVAPRGHFRRENCNIPPILIDFSNPGSPRHTPLGKLKLVIGCGTRGNDEQLLIREYLIYKMYNILEEKSFRVRLVRMNYRDSRNREKPFTQFAFLIEDEDDLAERNNCIKKPKAQYSTEGTNRELMTKVAVFEYLISNGDWSVPNNHNIRLIFDKNEPQSLPFVIPYDFDHSGFVNAGYAVPNELLGTESVTERVYRGFPRSMDELQKTLDVFRNKKSQLMALINNNPHLQSRNKSELVDFLEDFYRTINDKRQVQSIFIEHARKQ